MTARHDALNGRRRRRNAKGRQPSVWRRVTLTVVVILVLQLALLGAVTLILAALCSVTKCVNVVLVSPDRPTVRTISSPVIVASAKEPVVVAAAVTVTRQRPDSRAAAVIQGRVPAGQVTENAVIRSLLASRAAPMTAVAPPAAAIMTGAWRASVKPEEGDPGQADDLPTVVANATNWLRGIAMGLAILFVTLSGIRWLFAREPGDVDRARSSLGAACAGFAIALLAPRIMAILQNILGVSYG